MVISSSVKCRKTSGSWAPTTICLIGFVALSVDVAMQSSYASLYWDLFTDDTMPLLDRTLSYDSKARKLDFAVIWAETLPPIFNDAFIIWLAWVVFQKQRWALYLSIFMWILTFAIKANLGEQYQRMFKLRSILVLLVDSGASYMVLQSTFLGMYMAKAYIQSTSFLWAFGVLNALYTCISFVYPAITIFLVHGPFSIVSIHDTAMAFSIPADEPHAQAAAPPEP
ncbi:hypothetical protein DXG01_016961 [Tephrocybe rancida]|nr:hypothetical protein DXG01_016961 [Tephrocybe rancida]